MDSGDLAALEALLLRHPLLACERLESPGAWLRDKVGNALNDFFARPYLLWFVAEDPVRNGTLPANIASHANAIVQHARRHCAARVQEQIDYALRLVAWSWIARDAGVQIALIDTLVDAGAALGLTPNDALVNGNFAAAAHLVQRGAPLTLATALCLERWDDGARLAEAAPPRRVRAEHAVAAVKGKTEAVRRLLAIGVDVNAVSPDLYSHASPLHHAVSAGALATVELLVAAGARLDARDTAYDGTPLDWAKHAGNNAPYAEIAAWLTARGAR